MRTLFWKHIRDIILLPFTVTVLVPYWIYKDAVDWIPKHLALQILGVALMLTGLSLFGWTISLFNRIGKGTLAPWQATQQLVIQGPYRYCRNPMISGVLCILLGESALFHSAPIFYWALAFFCINTAYFIWVEEPSLRRRFGEP